MKKISLMLTLTVLLCFMSSIHVFAKDDHLAIATDIRNSVKLDFKVKEVACVAFSSTCGIAIRADNLYFQEDKNSLKSEIIKAVKEKYPHLKKVFVKLDLDIFLKTKAIEKALLDGRSIYSLKSEILQVLRLSEIRD